jgi:hypothetical protein
MGDPFSKPISRQTVDLSELDRLIKLDSKAIKKADDGFKTDAIMTFRSGLNRVIGTGKSTDLKTNQQTLASILTYIKTNTNEAVYRAVLASTTHLAGDNESIPIWQRLKQGTYVSSELVSQIKYATGVAIDKFDEVYQRQQKWMPDNLRAIDKFVGRETEDRTVGNVIEDAILEVKDKVFGKSESPFAKAVREICSEGTGEYPAKENAEVWKTVSRVVLGEGDQGAPLPIALESNLRNAATKAAIEGRCVTDDELKDALKKWITSSTVMPSLIDAANIDIVNRITDTPREFAKCLEEWGRQSGDGELKKAADWLAGKIAPLDDAGYGRTSLADRAMNLVFGKKDDGRDLGQMYNDMIREVRENVQATMPPTKASPQERRAWIE